LGKIEEGQTHVGALLALKPDFARRGRILIRHYIKFEDIVERVLEGLNAAGIEVR
jgi:adenylate cyclase